MRKINLSKWFMALLLVVFLAGCGGGGGGSGGAAGPAPVIPGACTEAGPAVESSSPTDGDLNVSISTADVLNDGKLITATFSEAMDPLTIESATPGALLTFTIKETVSGDDVPGTVLMNTAGTIATFTTSAPLLIDTEYTVTITVAAESALDNTPLGCEYEWSFTTGTSATAGQAPVDLGTASTYGIFASDDAQVTLAINALVDGDVGLMDGSGVCDNCTVTTVTGAIENGTPAAAQAQIDFVAAFTDASTRATGACTLAANTEIAGPQGACGGYTDPPGSIGSTTFNTYLPGLYWSASTIILGVGKTIVLDAQGDSSAVFIFQAGSAITTGDTSEILLVNNAQANNVFWVAGSAATLGVSSLFKGTVIANTGAITVNYGTTGEPTLVEGRLFSNGGAATVGAYATITVPTP
ncbi:MAG: DUF3494 domain-containing protein [Syntrophaceae bacterium]|nr:DUF3494 domain-containing protein [Syntrophaceae bacterium]